MKRFIQVTAFILALAFIPFIAYADRLDDSTLLSFYADSVIFGDSRLQAFRRYVQQMRKTDETFLKTLAIAPAESISLYAASMGISSDAVGFTYRGGGTMYSIAERVHARKVFIMLGLNDPVGIKADKAVAWIIKIINWMGKVVPDAEVYFFSETPVTKKYGVKKNRPNYQTQLDAYNEILKETCEQNGGHYIGMAEAFKGEDNYLKEEYSTDKICHLNNDGVAVWIQCMKDYAQEQYDLGLWDPYAKEEETAEPADNAE